MPPPSPSLNAPSEDIPWDAVPDPEGLIRSEACPACNAQPGEPCHHPEAWKTDAWPDGHVHSGREVRRSHALWFREILDVHGAKALAETCPHPGCGVGAGAPCPHLHEGRLALALARAAESRAAGDVARAVLDRLHSRRDSTCPVCGSLTKDGCRTRSGRHCMDHHGKLDTWSGSRAWLTNAIDAIEAEIYTCGSCQDGRRHPHRLCLEDAARRAHYADHPEEAPPWHTGPEPYSPEWLAAHIAAQPVLSIPCPECFAIPGEECRHNVDGKYVTCRQRRSAHARTTEPGLFCAAPIVMAPASLTRPSRPAPPAPALPPRQRSLF